MNYLLKHYKSILTILLIVVVIFGIDTHVRAETVSLQCGGDKVIGESGNGLFLVSLFLNFISWAWMIPAVLAGELMSNDLVYGQLVGLEHYFYQFWTLMRTIANFALVAIIIMVIIKIIRKPGEAMKTISSYAVRILMSGVLINMSWFLMGAAVDVSNIAITGVGQIGSQFMSKILGLDGADKQGEKQQRLDGIIKAIPSKITVDKCGCLIKQGDGKDNSNKTRENMIEKRNNIAGPLIFLGAGVLKLQAYSLDYTCSPGSGPKEGAGKITLKVILTSILALMFVVPLIVLVAFNLFRLIYLRGRIIFSPLIVLINLFEDEAKAFDIDDKTRNAVSRGTMFTGLLQPVFTSLALIMGMMLIVGVYDATKIGSTIDGVSNKLDGITNTSASSQVAIDNVGSVTMIDSLISDPTGTIGGGFGYLLLAVATCMVLWMLVKMSFTISKGGVGAAMGFDAMELMDRIRGDALKKMTLPKTGLGGPFDGVSLAEAGSLLDPSDKDNKIMKEISKIGNDMKDSSEKGAVKGIKKSRAGDLLGMDNNGEFENKYDFEKDKDLSKKEGLDLWNKAITQMKSEAKSIVSGNNKYESFMIEKSTKNYDSIKSRQKSVGGIIDETYKDVEGYKKEGGKFDDIYGEGSYSASLLKYVLSGKELKVKDGKLDEEIKKKLSISDTTFSQIDLSK